LERAGALFSNGLSKLTDNEGDGDEHGNSDSVKTMLYYYHIKLVVDNNDWGLHQILMAEYSTFEKLPSNFTDYGLFKLLAMGEKGSLMVRYRDSDCTTLSHLVLRMRGAVLSDDETPIVNPGVVEYITLHLHDPVATTQLVGVLEPSEISRIVYRSRQDFIPVIVATGVIYVEKYYHDGQWHLKFISTQSRSRYFVTIFHRQRDSTGYLEFYDDPMDTAKLGPYTILHLPCYNVEKAQRHLKKFVDPQGFGQQIEQYAELPPRYRWPYLAAATCLMPQYSLFLPNFADDRLFLTINQQAFFYNNLDDRMKDSEKWHLYANDRGYRHFMKWMQNMKHCFQPPLLEKR